MRLVVNHGNNHAVEVEEEHDQVETELEEGFLRHGPVSGPHYWLHGA